MRKWKIACGAAVLALGLATGAHADEWNKLTYLTFSGPVNMPGITLPAGTYRFELADPDTSRRVIRVSDKDGSKHYGIFLSISDRKLEPADNPVVMFKEMPAGTPQAVQAWFYPGETYGYEFVYPHDQALKIAKATHQSVLAMKEGAASSTDEERVASMKGADVSRIDENGKPVSTDEALKESSSLHPSNATTASNGAMPSSTAQSNTPQSTTAQSTTAQPNAAQSTPAQSTTAQSNTAQSNTAQSTPARSNRARANSARATTADTSRSVGTSGQTSQAATADNKTSADNTAKSSRRHLPRTAGELPLLELLSGLAFAGGASVRAFRRR